MVCAGRRFPSSSVSRYTRCTGSKGPSDSPQLSHVAPGDDPFLATAERYTGTYYPVPTPPAALVRWTARRPHMAPKVTVPEVRSRKRARGTPALVMLTAYDTPGAR